MKTVSNGQAELLHRALHSHNVLERIDAVHGLKSQNALVGIAHSDDLELVRTIAVGRLTKQSELIRVINDPVKFNTRARIAAIRKIRDIQVLNRLVESQTELRSITEAAYYRLLELEELDHAKSAKRS
jgi:hypothetical protein